MIPITPRLFIAGMLAACLCPAIRADEMPSPEALYQKAPKGLPSEPAWGFWPDAPKAWIMVHNQFVDRTKKGDIDIVFLGDSITKGWKQIVSTNWAGTTPALKAVNYGIGGDTTRQLLWRIRHGELDGITPRLVVLMIGTNSLYNDQNSGTNEQITDGVKAVLGLIHEKTPAARVLLLGVLPRQTKSWTDRIAAINGLLAGLDEPGRVYYRDAGAAFLSEDGRLAAGLYNADRVHPNAAGSEKLTATVKPWVKELLDMPSAAPATAK